MEHGARPLRLGHIVYSNCFPVHGGLVDSPLQGDPRMVEGIPSHLNRLLARGEIDVSPSSSIEYARHAEQYRVLPDLVIGARGPVRSILLLSHRHPRELSGQPVAIPTASATSVVLLKVLMRHRWKVEPRYTWFDQAREDPFGGGATAALFIGDVALRPGLYPHLPVRLDLGAEWMAHTGLPFAFAVWQANSPDTAGLLQLHQRLLQSRNFARLHRAELAARYADRFGLPAELLDSYWADLHYELDDSMLAGLRHFYHLASEIGEIPEVPSIRWVD